MGCFLQFLEQAATQLWTGYARLCTNTDEKQISLADKQNSRKIGFLLKHVIF
jgi:hypothetical protein